MILNTAPITPQSRFWDRVNALAREAFPPEEYLPPWKLAQRQKRRSFYLRNGYRETGLFLSYLGVDYEVFCTSSFDANTFKSLLRTIHLKGFAPRYYSINRRER